MSRSFSIPRTATFAWSKGSHNSQGTPLLATGTASGALDESFSSGASLELWDAFGEGDSEDRIKGRVSVSSKFNCLSWNTPSDGKPNGVLAAGMDSGELQLWDPAKILAGQADAASIFSTDRHKGTVRGLDWNTLQPSLFASGATDAEIFIWDTKNLTKPYGPSANKSRHLTDITALAWNPSVAHILATASSSGSTVIWDLKGRQEVIHLSYLDSKGSVYSQGPKPVSSVCWHAERGTRVITASEDDSAPVVLVWDLRNYRTPERILTGHEKGVLSLDWCKEDPDILLSCGKDCRTIAWNPSTGDIIGELPVTNNWSFKVASCPRNPGYVATASFDGKIGISTLQSTTETATADTAQAQPASDNAADIFSASNISSLAAQVHPGLSLKQPPRWLKRPVSSSFGFGGKLVTVGAPAQPAAGGAPSTTAQLVRVHQITTESDIVERALKLDNAHDHQALADFCGQRKDNLAGEETKATSNQLSTWKLLSSLFQANSREELVTLLGFSKDEVQQKVEEAIKNFKAASGRPGDLPLGFGNNNKTTSDSGEVDDGGSVAREPLVTFADQSDQRDAATDALSGSSEGEGAAAKNDNASTSNLDATPSETEASTSAISDGTTKLGGPESEITEPSLFGDDAPNNNAQQQATADFYTSLSSSGAAGRPTNLTDRFSLSQANVERAGSSVAATIGSRPSSVASENLKPTTFRIYPQDESEADRLLTRALVLGDFDSAVSLCLAADRFADALLLAVRGGADLLAKTQKAYFERRTTALPYLRLYQSIVSDDLTDVVQNADLIDWQEIFVVLCTFAKAEEYSTLIEQLGQRLEYQFSVAKASTNDGSTIAPAALEQRRSAVLCYLAARKLEKVVGIWKDELREEEKQFIAETGGDKSASAQYSAHARALQSFIEKVTVFKSATAYVDTDLAQPTTSAEVAESGARTYKLANLYDLYHEYAELLSAQGLVTLAVKYAALTPADYRSGKDGVSTRDRLQFTVGKTIKAPSVAQQLKQEVASKSAFSSAPVASTSSATTAYQPAAPSSIPAHSQAQPAYDDPYRPIGVQSQAPQIQPNPYAPQNNYAPSSNGYSADPYNPAAFVPQPPAPVSTPPVYPSAASQPVAPPPAKKAAGGWNDAPVVGPKRTGSAASHRPNPIMSPFPNAGPGPQYGGAPSAVYQQTGMGAPPPPSAGIVPPPPPSRGAMRTPGQQPQNFVAPPPARGTAQSQMAQAPPPPQGMRSPLGGAQGGPAPPLMMQGRPPMQQMGSGAPYSQGPGQQGGPGNTPPNMGFGSPPQNDMPPPGNRFAPPPQQGQQGGLGNAPPNMSFGSPPQHNMPQPGNRFGPPSQQGQQQMQGPGQYGAHPGQQPPQSQQNFVPPPPPRQQR